MSALLTVQFSTMQIIFWCYYLRTVPPNPVEVGYELNDPLLNEANVGEKNVEL